MILNFQKRIAYLLLSIFNIGYISSFPGTIASFASALFWYLFMPDNWIVQIIFIVSIVFIGIFAYQLVQNDLNDKDPQYIVLDELVGMWIALILVPYRFDYFLIAFLLFRYFDILKPSFIYRSQKIEGSLSVFIDDIISGVFTFLIMYSLIHIA